MPILFQILGAPSAFAAAAEVTLFLLRDEVKERTFLYILYDTQDLKKTKTKNNQTKKQQQAI